MDKVLTDIEAMQRIGKTLCEIYAEFPCSEENRLAIHEGLTAITATFFLGDILEQQDTHVVLGLVAKMQTLMNDYKKQQLAHLEN